jgi:hypothetical protein
MITGKRKVSKNQVEERIFNNTFKGAQPTRLNACVGNNGNPQQPEYAEGFIDASLSLCKLVVEDAGYLVDCYIYPIAFNMRHGVELWIKYFITQLVPIRCEIPIDTINLTATHDINILWQEFKNHAHLKDSRFKDITDRLDEYINNIGEIDPTAQTFRYPFSNESIKHLTQTPIINISNLASRLVSLKELLDELRSLIYYLIDEYDTGSYTSKLSRAQLFEMAKALPPKEEWADSSFKETRENIKQKFTLSSNKDFIKAIDIIKVHYEMAPLINVLIPLKAATYTEISNFLTHWSVFHPEREDAPLGTLIFQFSSIFNSESNRLESEALDNVTQDLSIEALADITVLYEFGRSPQFSEDYEHRSKMSLNEVSFIKDDKGKVSEYFNHLLYLSLKRLKQDEVIDALAKDNTEFNKEVEKCSK